MSYIVAIDLGGTSAKCAIVKQEGKIIIEFKVDTVVDSKLKNSNQILKNLKRAIDVQLIKYGISLEAVLIIGLTVPGQYNNKTNIVSLAPNINWENYNIINNAQLIWPKQVIICLNDADAAGIGKYSENKEEAMIGYILGTGLGGFIIRNANLVLDKDGNSIGEFGHRNLENGEEQYSEILCNCGLIGCLETIVSASAFNRSINQYIKQWPNSYLSIFKAEHGIEAMTTIDLNNFVKTIANDHPKFKEFEQIFQYAKKILAKHILRMYHLNKISSFYFAGGGAKLDYRFFESIVIELATIAPNSQVKITVVKDADKLGLKGIIYHALLRLKQIQEKLVSSPNKLKFKELDSIKINRLGFCNCNLGKKAPSLTRSNSI